MTAAPEQSLEELKSRVDLVEFIRSSGIELKKAGKNFLGRCPFHDDSKPSLSVSPEKNLWNCLGCEAGGDALQFLQLKEKLDFPAAVARLKEIAGTPPDPAPPLPTEFKRPELLARVAELYQKRLLEAAEAQAYLKGRGLEAEAWKAFRVGFCDGTLLKTLPQDGAIIQALQSLGILTQDRKEHFRGCIVVPLTHPDRGVVGFYGRRIRPDAKVPHLYLPGPRQGVLNWQALKASASVVLAESVLDAVSLWQAGVREASCIFGVQGFTEDLQALLKRFEVQEVTLCLDGDRAGLEATQKFSGVLQTMGLRACAVRLPDDKDPNLVLRESGAEALFQLVRNKQELSAPGSAPAQSQVPTVDGFTLEIGEVTYSVQPMPPFASRLRINLRAQHAEKWMQDRFDLYVHRDRAKLVTQITSQLGLPRLEADRHQLALYKECEGWATAQKIKAQAADKPKPPEMNESERQEALRFLRHPHLTERLLADMEALGYVGEEHAKLLVYLIGVSRKLPKPLSGIIISQSGSGKSSLTEVLEVLTPPEDVMLFTRITSQALVYMVDNLLKGKVIIVEERVGAEAAEYSIRVLQSRHKLTQAVPVKDPLTGQIVTKIFTVEGPVAYLETTTDPRINHENATRCFEITLDETEEQTQRIQAFQRSRRLPGKQNRHLLAEEVAQRHHQAQRLLEDVLVFIPYAEQLIFPTKRLRTRRDNERFLCLIEAAAYLHQFQRERGTLDDGTPYILANLDDYRLAYDLAKDVLSDTLHELNRGAREIWLKVRDWVLLEGPEDYRSLIFTRRDLRIVTGVEDHQLRQALQELVDMEYLEIVSGANGKTFHYRLIVARDQDAPVTLLSPEELERRLAS